MGDIESTMVSIRRKMVTLGMALCCFVIGKPCAKHHKSIPVVTIFLLTSERWRILYSPCDMCGLCQLQTSVCVLHTNLPNNIIPAGNQH